MDAAMKALSFKGDVPECNSYIDDRFIESDYSVFTNSGFRHRPSKCFIVDNIVFSCTKRDKMIELHIFSGGTLKKNETKKTFEKMRDFIKLKFDWCSGLLIMTNRAAIKRLVLKLGAKIILSKGKNTAMVYYYE